MWPNSLFALVTDDHMLAPKTGRLVARFAVDTVFTLTTESRLAHVAAVFAFEAACLVALGTTGIRIAVVAALLVALATDDNISALKTGRLVACFTVESVFALTAEFLLAFFAMAELFAVVAECLPALDTDVHIFNFALKTT
jgi:hypothetical protein